MVICDSVNKSARGGWGTATINLGDAFWIQASGSDSHEIILSGDVNTAAVNSSTIAAGIDATGLFFPVETTFGATDLSSSLAVGSSIHIWDDALSHTRRTINLHVVDGAQQEIMW